MENELTHLDEQGRIRMVDIGSKSPLHREAEAECVLRAASATLDRVLEGRLPKGEALAASRLAGVLAAKRTDELVPLCHTLPLDAVHVDFQRVAPDRLRIRATASTVARTGVEMEALVAASVAALTLYDMTKAVDKDMIIDGLRVLRKEKRQPT